eukprot:729712-Rhodomonas_salina.2
MKDESQRDERANGKSMSDPRRQELALRKLSLEGSYVEWIGVVSIAVNPRHHHRHRQRHLLLRHHHHQQQHQHHALHPSLALTPGLDVDCSGQASAVPPVHHAPAGQYHVRMPVSSSPNVTITSPPKSKLKDSSLYHSACRYRYAHKSAPQQAHASTVTDAQAQCYLVSEDT